MICSSLGKAFCFDHVGVHYLDKEFIPFGWGRGVHMFGREEDSDSSGDSETESSSGDSADVKEQSDSEDESDESVSEIWG